MLRFYAISLTIAEARRARAAVDQFAEEDAPPPYIDHGRQTLERSQWADVARWLEWRSTDFELKLELSERKACQELTCRIEFALAGEPSRVEDAKPAVVAAAASQKSLFGDFK